MRQPTHNLKVATINDLEIIKPMAKRFFEASPYKDYPMQEDLFDNYVKSFLTDDAIKMIIISFTKDNQPAGFIAFELGMWSFSPVLAGIEKAMWVDEEYRKDDHAKDLLGAFEFCAKKSNCKILQLSSIAGELEKSLDKFYKKMNYDKVESIYLKKV